MGDRKILTAWQLQVQDKSKPYTNPCMRLSTITDSIRSKFAIRRVWTGSLWHAKQLPKFWSIWFTLLTIVHEADEKTCAFWWINGFCTILKQISCRNQKSMLASLNVSSSPSILLMSTNGWNWKWSTFGCDLCTLYLITSHLWRKQLRNFMLTYF